MRLNVSSSKYNLIIALKNLFYQKLYDALIRAVSRQKRGAGLNNFALSSTLQAAGNLGQPIALACCKIQPASTLYAAYTFTRVQFAMCTVAFRVTRT